jgi:hypothetical protein
MMITLFILDLIYTLLQFLVNWHLNFIELLVQVLYWYLLLDFFGEISTDIGILAAGVAHSLSEWI